MGGAAATCGGNHDVINGKHEADSQSMVINLTPKTPRPGIGTVRMLCSTSWKLEDPWTLPLISSVFFHNHSVQGACHLDSHGRPYS